MRLSVRRSRKELFFFCYMLVMVSAASFGQIEPLDPDYIPNPDEQDASASAIGTENDILKEQVGNSDLNRITLQQMYNQNRATIIQLSGPESGNYANVVQNGDLNSTLIFQTGKHNGADVSQDGYGNKFLGIHAGENVISSVVQGGDENVIRQFLMGSEMNYRIEQDGKGNVVNQFQYAPDGAGYKVIQNGDNMKITILQDNIYK